MRVVLALCVLGLVALVLFAPNDSAPQPPSKAEQAAAQYRACVGVDRSRARQNLCQVRVWGETFGEDDPRWLCDRMGNWLCALRPDPKL